MSGLTTRRALLQVALGGWVAARCGAARGNAVAATAADSLAERARRLLAALHDGAVDAMLTAWPVAGPARTVPASTVPVLRYLPAAGAAAPAFSAGFVSALAAAAPGLAWRRSYTAAQVGAAFLDAYGWTELVGLSGPVPGTTLACGVLLLGPGVSYPPHHHEAEEIYVPLSGIAEWRHGAAPWVTCRPGDVVHHLSNQSHAMRTGTDPLLALYLWRSGDLAQHSQLDPADS